MSSKVFIHVILLTLLYSVCQSCDNGWENFQSKKCIKYFPENKNYQQAVDLCRENQGALVSIDSYEEQDFVETMAKRHSKISGVHWAWIGATRPHEQTTEFVWTNGRTVNFTRWRNGCPDSRTSENCVLMTVFKDRQSHWCNFKCDSNFDHVICEKNYTASSSATQKPAATVKPVVESNGPCPTGWELYDRKCFKFHGANVTGDEARHICKHEHDGSMVSIHSEEEMAFLIEFLFYTNGATEAAWIGLKRRADNSSEFYWINNKPLNFTNWGFHEPDNRHLAGPENCVIINDMKQNYGRWIDVPCHLEFLLICERDAKLDKGAGDNGSTDSSVTNSATPGNNGESSKLQSQVAGTCSHGVWLALLSICVVMLFASLGVLYYHYRKKINEGNLYSSTIDFANIRDFDRSANDYNQDIGVAEPSQIYSEITYQPSSFAHHKLPTRK